MTDMTSTLHDERVEKIARWLRDEFAMREDDDEKHVEQWIGDAKRIIAADPYTAEVERLTGLLAEVEKALRNIIAANDDFRSDLPNDWDGDPVNDACIQAIDLLSRIGSGRGGT